MNPFTFTILAPLASLLGSGLALLANWVMRRVRLAQEARG